MIPSSPNWEKTWNSASRERASGGSAAHARRLERADLQPQALELERQRRQPGCSPPRSCPPPAAAVSIPLIAHALRIRSNSSRKSSTPLT